MAEPRFTFVDDAPDETSAPAVADALKQKQFSAAGLQPPARFEFVDEDVKEPTPWGDVVAGSFGAGTAGLAGSVAEVKADALRTTRYPETNYMDPQQAEESKWRDRARAFAGRGSGVTVDKVSLTDEQATARSGDIAADPDIRQELQTSDYLTQSAARRRPHEATDDPWSVRGLMSQSLEAGTRMAPGIALSVLTQQPVFALTGVGVDTYGSSMQQGREMGLDADSARARAIFLSAAEVITEKVPVEAIIHRLPGAGKLASIAKAGFAEGTQEVLAQALQIGYDMGVVDQNMTVSQALESIAQAGVVGAIVGGMLRAPVAALPQHEAPAPTDDANTAISKGVESDESLRKLWQQARDSGQTPTYLPGEEGYADRVRSRQEPGGQTASAGQQQPLGAEGQIGPDEANGRPAFDERGQPLRPAEPGGPGWVPGSEGVSGSGPFAGGQVQPAQVGPIDYVPVAPRDTLALQPLTSPVEQGIPYEAPTTPAVDALAAPIEQRIAAFDEQKKVDMQDMLSQPSPTVAEFRSPMDRLAEPVEQALAPAAPKQPEGLEDRRILQPEFRRDLESRAKELEQVRAPNTTGDVDPTVDSLLTAIAKVGGWDRADAESEGIDPADAVGKRSGALKAFPTKGAKHTSLDSLREDLAQYGYAGEDPQVLAADIDKALRGEPVFSNSHDTNAAGPRWFQELHGSTDTRIAPPAMRSAIGKALAGEKLGTREARIVQAMLEDASVAIVQYDEAVDEDPMAAWAELAGDEQNLVDDIYDALEAGATTDDLAPIERSNIDDILSAKYALDEWLGRRPNGPQGQAADIAVKPRAERAQSDEGSPGAASEGDQPARAPAQVEEAKPAEDVAEQPLDSIKFKSVARVKETGEVATITESADVLARQMAKRMSAIASLLDCIRA